MDILPFYTVEFKMKSSYIAKRQMSEKILREFLDRVKSRSASFRLHPAPIGFQDNKRVGYVYFYSNLAFGDVYRTAEYFAQEKRYEFIVQRNQLQEQKKPMPQAGKFESGGMINFFTGKTSLKEIFNN